MEVNNELHQYQWIVNEGLLRDEGTLYGIAGVGVEEKISAIRDYYSIKKAGGQVKQEHLKEKIGLLNKQLFAPGGSSLEIVPDPCNPIPVLLQLLFYAGICYFNYWLESYWLSPVLQSTFICLGLYLFGLFSVFIGRSILYNSFGTLADEKSGSDRREKWKIYFEELGVPLIVSFFISILPRKAYPLEFSIVACLFFFMLFLFGGKGLINTFFRTKKEFNLLFEHWRQLRKSKRKTGEMQRLEVELETVNAVLQELGGEEEYKIKVLVSEYKLAFESRLLANSVPMKKFA